jgi:hypothetical protein
VHRVLLRVEAARPRGVPQAVEVAKAPPQVVLRPVGAAFPRGVLPAVGAAFPRGVLPAVEVARVPPQVEAAVEIEQRPNRKMPRPRVR